MDQPDKQLPDILAPGLKVVFVGFNPSLISWEKGHHYANPVNNFYRLLYQAGLTPHLVKAEEDLSLLDYGIGSTNLVLDLPSATETALPVALYRAGRVALENKLNYYRPKIVCFNGLKLYSYCFGEKLPNLGLQITKTFAGRPLFVTPSSSGAANKYYEVRRSLYRELKERLDHFTELVEGEP